MNTNVVKVDTYDGEDDLLLFRDLNSAIRVCSVLQKQIKMSLNLLKMIKVRLHIERGVCGGRCVSEDGKREWEMF